MGFSLGGLLGPALTVATQSAGTYQQGQANAQQAQTQALMQQIALKRQADQDALRNALVQAQTGEAGARTVEANARSNALQNPVPKPAPRPVVVAPGGTVLGPDNKPVYTAPPAPKIDQSGEVSERQREQGWRQTYSKRVAELQQPQVDPTNPFLKQPGMSYADAQAQAAQEATDAWGAAPKGVRIPNATGPRVPKAAPTVPGAPKMPATPQDSATAKLAAQRIQSGQATLEQALASPNLSPAVKALLQSGYTGNE